MSVLVAVQEAIDAAFHIVADERWGVPASYAEGFELLASRSVIDGGLRDRMVAAAGLRNRIAHGYAAVDLERLWSELPEGLDALEEYGKALAAFVGGDG